MTLTDKSSRPSFCEKLTGGNLKGMAELANLTVVLLLRMSFTMRLFNYKSPYSREPLYSHTSIFTPALRYLVDWTERVT